MIYVSRNKRDENRRQIKPSKGWFDKAKTATRIAIREKRIHQWLENIYTDEREIKPALEKLFNDKCAYCEKSLLDVDWDVEHFRPKGEVAKRKDHPGYYWLAYKWENLYPACKKCNQNRRDKPLWEDRRALPAGGKSTKFPLYDESTRAMTHNQSIEKEFTLLIDPCYDNPEWYFGYDPKGKIFALDDNPFGDKSIEIFNLTRRRLNKGRRKIIKRTTKVLQLIKGVQKKKTVSREILRGLKDILNELVSGEDEYTGVARYVKNNPATFLE